MHLEVEGSDKVIAKLKYLADVIDKNIVSDVVLDAAKIIQSDAKSRAPRGETGNLQKGIVAKKAKKKRKMFASSEPSAVSFVAIDRAIAKHAYWIEFGTAARKPLTKKVMADKEKGIIYGTIADPMPAKPFFRPAVDHKASEARQYMKDGILRAIQDAVSKNG